MQFEPRVDITNINCSSGDIVVLYREHLQVASPLTRLFPTDWLPTTLTGTTSFTEQALWGFARRPDTGSPVNLSRLTEPVANNEIAMQLSHALGVISEL